MSRSVDEILEKTLALAGEEQLELLAKLLAAMHENGLLEQLRRTSTPRHWGLRHRDAHDRLIDSHLERIQDQLLPEYGELVVALNTESGEYVLGNDSAEAKAAYMKRWPNGSYFVCRVDGSPAMRM